MSLLCYVVVFLLLLLSSFGCRFDGDAGDATTKAAHAADAAADDDAVRGLAGVCGGPSEACARADDGEVSQPAEC